MIVLVMRGINVVDLSFPDELQDPDIQVKCLTYMAQQIRSICPRLPDNVKPFVMRGRAAGSRHEIPLLGLHERQITKKESAWDYFEARSSLQQWIDEQAPDDLLARIADTRAPTFADLDDRRK